MLEDYKKLVIKSPTDNLNTELDAIKLIWGILENLHPASRNRILTWINSVYK